MEIMLEGFPFHLRPQQQLWATSSTHHSQTRTSREPKDVVLHPCLPYFFILSMTRKFSFPLSGVFTLLDKRWSSFGCNHQAVVNNSRRRNQSGTNLDL